MVAQELSQYCEDYSKLHAGQMGGRKERSAIDAVAILVHTVQEKWEEKKLAAALFMNVKGAFGHISKGQLLTRMIELGTDGDLVTWTGSFLTDRRVQLVIDGHDNKEREIETGIPQGSPVSPIFFLIYISGVFNKVSETSPLVTSLSFVDDLGFIASGSSVKEIVVPPTQGTWRSNDYVSAVRLVDACFYGVGRWTIIYILGGRYKHVRPLSPSHPNITFPSTSHLHTSRQR